MLSTLSIIGPQNLHFFEHLGVVKSTFFKTFKLTHYRLESISNIISSDLIHFGMKSNLH